jgi:hypothetical protein
MTKQIEGHTPADVDFHDATIGSITICADSSVVFDFDHLCIFYPAEIDRYEVWSAKARLLCFGVERFEVKGKFIGDVCVSEASIQDDQGKEIVPMPISPETARVNELCFTMMSGTMIQLTLDRALLEVLANIRRLEDWTGPLR